MRRKSECESIWNTRYTILTRQTNLREFHSYLVTCVFSFSCGEYGNNVDSRQLENEKDTAVWY